jgi:Fe(3+) dicitrate transport protein
MRLSLSFLLRCTGRVLCSALALFGSSQATAQTLPPAMAGRVVDVSGAVVPGATVIVRRQSGEAVATLVTDDTGRFAVSDLTRGDYAVTAALDGFSLAAADVTIAGAPITLELTLRPGALSEELTVVGARLVGSDEMRRRVPGSFDLLTREMLDSAHVFTTSEALRKVPGVTVRDEEGVGLRPNIGIRGLNPTRSSKVLLLEDGVPTAFAPYGDNASYYHPPIDRFERVEVLKGSSQITHGPVTLGGVINYITPDPPTRPSLAVEFAGGNREFVNAGASVGTTWRRTGVFAQAQRKQSDGARENIHSDLHDVMGKLTHAFGATRHLTLKGNYYAENSQVTYSGLREAEYRANPRQNPFLNDAFDGDRVGGSAVYRTLLGSRLALTTTAYASQFGRDWWRQSSNSSQRPNDAADPLCGGMANLTTTCGNEGRLRMYRHGGVETRARMAIGGAVPQEIDVGVRLHAERQHRRQENGATPLARTGVRVEDNERTTDAMSAFFQHRFLAGAWTITPGVRVEHVRYSRTNVLLNATGATRLAELVPGIGVSYLFPGETTVFAGMHRGFAPPRAEDIINNTTGGSIDLDPERSWNYEAGARTRVGRALALDATWFRLDYQNQIVPASLAGGVGAMLTNGGQTLHEGLELGASGDWRRLAGSAHGIYTRAAFTWLPVARFSGTRMSNVPGFGMVSVAGNRLPYAPEALAAVTAGYRHERGLDVQVEAQHTTGQFSDDLNTRTGTADGQRGLIAGHTYWNTALSWRLPQVPGTVFLAVKNLMDATFIVDRSRGILPSHPRLVQVGTSWRF